jgi:hypothetical protein
LRLYTPADIISDISGVEDDCELATSLDNDPVSWEK